MTQRNLKMKQKSQYELITEAREILQITEEATIDEIKNSFHELMLNWHPDKSAHDNHNIEESRDKSQKIIEAYQLIMNYCKLYKISFSKESVEKYDTKDEFWWKRFGNDPMWGPI